MYVINQEGSKRLARILADRAGLSVQFDKDCEQPKTNLTTGKIIVRTPDPFWDKKTTTEWFGQLCHEIGHHAPNMLDDMSTCADNKIGLQSFMGGIYNIVSDYRNEVTDHGMYTGRDEALSYAQGASAARGYPVAKESDPENAQMEMMKDIFNWVYTARSEWQPDLLVPSANWNEVCSDRFFHHTSELNAMQTGEDCLTLVKKIIDEDPELDLEEEEKAAAEAADQEGEGEGSKSESSDLGKGDEEGEGEGKGWVSYKDCMTHDHSDSMGEGGGHIKYDHERVSDFTPWDKMDVVHVDPNTDGSDSREYQPDMQKAYTKGRALAGTVRKLLQTRSQVHYESGHKRGKISARSLHRTRIGSDKVFKRKSEAIDLDVSVSLLVDMSGSMSGSRYVAAAAAAAMLNDAISFNGIPLEIIGFTEDSRRGCRHFIYKTFKKRISGDQLVNCFSHHGKDLYQNSDGESVLYATSRLRAEKSSRKILIVLSDGEPACDNQGDAFTFTKEAIKYAERHVEVYGIGIETTAVSELYKEHTVLRDSSELEKCLLEVIQNKIIK
jgi:cobalamin biosynthesis protein CobT